MGKGLGIVPPREYGQITGKRTDGRAFTWNFVRLDPVVVWQILCKQLDRRSLHDTALNSHKERAKIISFLQREGRISSIVPTPSGLHRYYVSYRTE